MSLQNNCHYTFINFKLLIIFLLLDKLANETMANINHIKYLECGKGMEDSSIIKTTNNLINGRTIMHFLIFLKFNKNINKIKNEEMPNILPAKKEFNISNNNLNDDKKRPIGNV